MKDSRRKPHARPTRAASKPGKPVLGPPPAIGEAALGLRERKKVRLRQRIAEVALVLYRERGDSTTLDEICRRVEISQPTFYKYYPSKEAILTEYATRGWGELLDEALAEPGALAPRLQRYFIAIAEQMTRDRKLWYAIAISNAYNPVRDPRLLRSMHAGTRALERLLSQGQHSGELTREFEAQRLASMLEGIMLRVSIEWGAGYPNKHPLAASMTEALTFFLRATRP
jgi:AcrR family transcriptional regulator